MKKLREYQVRCNSCGQIMDIRDLSQVFAHEDCNGVPIDYNKMKQVQHSGALKVGEPTLYIKECGDILLN